MPLLGEILGQYTAYYLFSNACKVNCFKKSYYNSNSENRILNMDETFSDNHHLIDINLHLIA